MVEVGTVRYLCIRFEDSDCCRLYRIRVLEEVPQGLTPKGNPRKPKYKLALDGFNYKGKREVVESESSWLLTASSSTAKEAVRKALQEFFAEYKPDQTPEERLLRAIFGKGSEDSVHLTVDNIDAMIEDLEVFKALIAEAIKVDSMPTYYDGWLKRGLTLSPLVKKG